VASTLIQEATNGREYRLPRLANPKWTWQLDYGCLIDDAQFSWAQQNFMAQQLQGFFGQLQGQWQNFLYRDPYDYTTGTTPMFTATGDGVSQAFPLYRNLYGLVERIQYCDSLTGAWMNGSPITATITTNMPSWIQFGSVPPAGSTLTWTGTWYFLCRLAKDTYEFSHEGFGIWMLEGLEFQSVIS
jgi:hypothetical protein